DWVIAEITRYPTSERGAQARVVERLDPDRPLALAQAAAIARYDLPVEFPAAALREAECLGTEVRAADLVHRVDLRELPLVTIDGEDARDFDDAVYAEENARGWRLVVAIADVSHYVRIGSALDAEARRRGTSVYFPRRVLPMLPPALSDHLCSLQPEVDRLCMVADLQLTRRGELSSTRIYPAVMRSAARLTYTLAYAALFEHRRAARAELGSLLPKLEPLVEVYRLLARRRRRRGALEFDAPEAVFEFDAAERVRAVRLYERNEAHKLIEECMILANVAVARELLRGGGGALFRVHGTPDPLKIERLQQSLALLGVGALLPEEPTTLDLRKIAERVAAPELRPLVESLIVRSLKQAQYQAPNIGHFGLALREYAHFTSPIRRYPDLVVHRALRAQRDRSDPCGYLPGPDELTVLGVQMSALERRADEADRDVDTFLKCSYLVERIGQTFAGVVTTVTEAGCFVQLSDLLLDGLLRLDRRGAHDFTMADSGAAWVSRAQRRELKVGSRVHVIVTAVNPVEGLVDLELAA
ncbi:MAG: VacB/RNase II family 3'-5' exoribonuclease, partial [Steroidobacteraceae bacterium]|nr:VacB/RNase II family 3'-5' exoribonuclease [Steroidobacteraceae bacterium]